MKHVRIHSVHTPVNPSDGVKVELTCSKYALPNCDSTAPIVRVYDEEDSSKIMTVTGLMPAHHSLSREVLTLLCDASLVYEGMIVEVVGNAWETVDVPRNKFGRIPLDAEYEFPFVNQYEA